MGFVAPPVPDDVTARPPTLMTYTCLVNFTGMTAASVPCGFVDGLPVGIQVMAPEGGEAAVLRVCAALERELPPPPRYA